MKEPIIFDGKAATNSKMLDDYKRIIQIPFANPKMDDERRTIHEEDNEANQSSTKAFLIKAGGLPLGNHFHLKKTEVFCILEGKVELLVTNDQDQTYRREYRNISAGSMIIMPPGVAHTFFLAPDSKMICYGTGCFDPTDMTALKLA